MDFLESGTESGYPPVKCLNTVGSYDCVCSDGYALVNGSCETVDACPGEVFNFQFYLLFENIY